MPIADILAFLFAAAVAGYMSFLEILKDSNRSWRRVIIWLGLTCGSIFFGIYSSLSKQMVYDSDKKEFRDTAKAVETKIDTSNFVISRAIDTARNRIVDSVSKAYQNTVLTLQKTIRNQTHELDSLLRLHGEKHLTSSEKKDILRKIDSIIKENGLTRKVYGIMAAPNSNGTAFTAELIEFLTKNGYEKVAEGQSINYVDGYQVLNQMRMPVIIIGAFKI